MTKEEFIKASKNFAKYYSGIKLPIDENSLIDREGCNYFFFYEFPSEYVDNDDNDVECTYWYSVSNYKDKRPEDGIEFATGIDGRPGDHFFISSKDWQEEKSTRQ
ncbi:MAG: hypothetical protein IJP61_12570 [Treponema sp.]|nr:hypothetical protein [Treponema sp.]MBR0033099.1 hypothetical protein [Treponema sp.]